MNNTVNSLDDNICEQLSAWMDGELSKDEALFLERRLQHDQALQSLYSRMQMTSACMKGQSTRLMPNTLCLNIKQELANESTTQKKSRTSLIAWAAAASIAFVAFVFVPGLMQTTPTPNPEANFAVTQPAIVEPSATATFASADLVADTSSATRSPITISVDIPSTEINPIDNPIAMNTKSGVVSPEDFPLNISAAKKAWPRSAVNANSDPALEAYLVRHNQMMAQDGMGGFVPYVDVVAQDTEASDANSKDAAGGNQ